MRGFAYTILAIILAAFLIEPMIEVAVVLKEKVTLSAAITNATQVAKMESIKLEEMRELDAVIDTTIFMEVFSTSICEVLDAQEVLRSGDSLTLRGLNNPNKVYTITFNFTESVDPVTDKTFTTIKSHTQTKYLFKTAYLREADAKTGIDYHIICDRLNVVIIEN